MAHIPVLRRGTPYVSLDKIDVIDHRNGSKLIDVSQVGAGIVRKDLPKFAASRDALRSLGYKVEWHEYAMAHSVCMEEIADLNSWLLKALAKA